MDAIATSNHWLEQYVGIALERQTRLSELVAGRGWSLDLRAATLSFGEDLCFPIQVLGSFSYEAESWLWSWANNMAGLPTSSLQLAHRLREFGQQHSLEILSEAGFPFSERELHLLGVLGSGVGDADGYYIADYGDGALLVTLTADQLRQRRGENPESLLGVFPQVAAAFEVDHRRALTAYAVAKGFQVQQSTAQWQAVHPQMAVHAEFDSEGRLLDLQARPDQGSVGLT